MPLIIECTAARTPASCSDLQRPSGAPIWGVAMASRGEKGGTYVHLHACTLCGEQRWVTRGVHRRMDVDAHVRLVRQLLPPLTTTLTTCICVRAALRLWLRLEGGGLPARGGFQVSGLRPLCCRSSDGQGCTSTSTTSSSTSSLTSTRLRVTSAVTTSLRVTTAVTTRLG